MPLHVEKIFEKQDEHQIKEFNAISSRRIIKFTEDKTLLITGCQGTRTSVNPLKFYGGHQKTIADAKRSYALANRKNYLGILLGDHFYDDGVDDPNSQFFVDGFESLYDFDAPYFNVLGNHDLGMHGGHIHQHLYTHGDAYHNKRAAAQVLRTFHPANKRMLSQQGSVDSQFSKNYQLKHWNMPGRYYCLEFPSAVFFVIDSNTYYFDLHQQVWLKKLYAEYPDKKKVLVSHHPFFSHGKRGTEQGKKGDVKKYWLREYGDYAAWNTYFSQNLENHSMSDLLLDKLMHQELYFDVLLCAHDHMLAVSEHMLHGNPLTQIVMGGGGSPLDERRIEIEGTRLVESAYGFMDLNTQNLKYNIMRVIPNSKWSHGFQTEIIAWIPPLVRQATMRHYEPIMRINHNVLPSSLYASAEHFYEALSPNVRAQAGLSEAIYETIDPSEAARGRLLVHQDSATAIKVLTGAIMSHEEDATMGLSGMSSSTTTPMTSCVLFLWLGNFSKISGKNNIRPGIHK